MLMYFTRRYGQVIRRKYGEIKLPEWKLQIFSYSCGHCFSCYSTSLAHLRKQMGG